MSDKSEHSTIQQEIKATSNPNSPSHVPLSAVEIERKELLAAKQIEQAMTHAVTRSCYNCHKRYVKHLGCSHVVCVCGAHNCYKCGKELRGMHTCERRLTPTNQKAINRAAANTKKSLLIKYPFLRFKYDPSKHAQKRKKERKEKMRK